MISTGSYGNRAHRLSTRKGEKIPIEPHTEIKRPFPLIMRAL
jgi:hypothetical protein